MPPFLSGRRRYLFALLMLLSFGQVGFGIVAAGAVGRLFAGLAHGAPLDRFASAELAVAILATGLAEFGRRWTTEALGLDYAHKVRMVLFERLLRRPFRNGSSRSRGNVLLPFVGDLTALRQWWADGVARGISSAIIAIGLCVFLAVQNLYLGMALGALLLTLLSIIALLARPYAHATRKQRRERGVMTGLISDRIASAHSVVALGGLQRELGGVDKRIARMNRAALSRARWSGVGRAIAAGAHLAGTLVTLLVAAALAGTGAIEVHKIVGSLTLVGLLGGCIGDLVRAGELAIPARISRIRIEARLAEIEPLRMRGAAPVQAEPDGADMPLRLQEFSLGDDEPAFSSVARDGDVILVDGDPGIGKSTLLAAIAGFQPAPAGHVFTLGKAATRLPQKVRREAIGYAGAAAPLLQATMAGNLLYRLRGPIDEHQLVALMRAAGLSSYLDADGAIAPVRIRDGGQSLPGAVVQAIQIVRAMAGAPRLLILDNVFDALADRHVTRLAELLREWPGVVILVTRRPGIRAAANRRWLVAADGITEQALATAPVGTADANVLPITPRRKA